MRLYAGSSSQFITDTIHNQIADKLRLAFFDYFRRQPSPGEVSAWRNSLRAMSQVVQYARLDDHGVLLEYQLPLTSRRLDCLITGRDGAGSDNALIIELKQWEHCGPAEGEREVTTWLGGVEREILHPSVQVGQYKHYLEDGHTAFHEGDAPVRLGACSYLHNYTFAADDVLLDPKYGTWLAEFPVFSADDVDPLRDALRDRLEGGAGLDVLARIERGRNRPSKKLMEHVAEVIRHNPAYVLLDEQLVVYDKVLACARRGHRDRRTNVILIRGGPGTGKSVIAINLMADLLAQGYNAHYATGSKAFTQTLRKVIGTRGAVQFKYFNSYMDAEPDAVDVLICDEAHRIRQTSDDRFTPRERRTGRPQIEEILRAGKVVVLLIDDDQVVRPNEIGSVAYLRGAAERLGCTVHEYELDVQFRCAGSEAFVSWINNTLGLHRTADVLWNSRENFDFRIVDSPESLERAIAAKAAEGFTARLTAGFCWKWSKPNPDGTLKPDVVIGGFQRPWNAKPEARRLARGVPPAPLWAHESGGLHQIGCIYTAQGFEFDYAGVIFGRDLVYDLDAQRWEGRPAVTGRLEPASQEHFKTSH
ncbi:MAG: DUF2075 domain-containing protein [Acidobacteria bacterium]|nr:DUF2075 domain-containing protein [Acidobacteriota bacterium]